MSYHWTTFGGEQDNGAMVKALNERQKNCQIQDLLVPLREAIIIAAIL